MSDHMVGFHSPALTDGGWWNPSALTSSVICPPNVTHVPAETGKVGSGQGCLTTRAHCDHLLFCTRHDSACHVLETKSSSGSFKPSQRTFKFCCLEILQLFKDGRLQGCSQKSQCGSYLIRGRTPGGQTSRGFCQNRDN